MNGIICWLCSILAILALLLASQRWQNELNKNQEKDVSQPNHDPWWIWPRECLRSCLQLHQTQGWPRKDFKILKDLFQLTIERGNLWKRQDLYYLQEDYGRYCYSQEWKSGAAEPDRSGKPEVLFGMHCKELTLIVRNLFSAETRTLQGTESWFTIERVNLCQCISKNWLISKILSWAVTKQNLWTKSKTKCETDRRMSSIAENCTEHSIISGMFMATTLNAATFMGKNCSTVQSGVKNHEDLTLKQMFDVTAQMVNNQDEINGLDKILHGKNSWTHLSLINDEVVINLQSTSLCLLGFCVVPRKGSSTSWIQRSLEEHSCGSTSREKLQRLWCYQWRVDWIRVEHFPRIHNVAALW